MCKLAFNTVRYILRVVGSFIGMAESTESTTTSPKATDTKAFNEFIPGKTPSVGTHQGTSDNYGSNKKTELWNKPDFDKMSLDDKRSYYRCENNFLTLDQISPWPDYVLHNQYVFIKEGLLRKHDKLNHDNDLINRKVSLWRGDITSLEIDAIVNAANKSLLGGGGVDGCIHRAAGKGLFKECKALNGCKTGQAKITSGYKLPAKKVIHTVGPIGENKRKLQSCYKNCLELAKEHNLRTVAFCCISTGVYGYPYEEAAIVAVETVREWLEENKDEVDRIIFCVFLESDLAIYHQLMLQYFPCTVAVFEEDDDQGAVGITDEASTKEHDTTGATKGDEKGVKKTVGDGDHLGERYFLAKPPTKAQSKEDVGSSSDDLDHRTKFNSANGNAQSKEDDESGIDSCEKNKMHVDISHDEEGDDGVERCAENSGLNEATENARDDDDEDVEGNSSKAVDEKVEKTEADREMKKRKREGDVEAAKMDLDVEASEVVHREDGTLESSV